MADDVKVYAVGACYASACAPQDASRESIEHAVNHEHPTGVSPWKVADEPFGSGEPNPCPCQDDPARLHYLLNC